MPARNQHDDRVLLMTTIVSFVFEIYQLLAGHDFISGKGWCNRDSITISVNKSVIQWRARFLVWCQISLGEGIKIILGCTQAHPMAF